MADGTVLHRRRKSNDEPTVDIQKAVVADSKTSVLSHYAEYEITEAPSWNSGFTESQNDHGKSLARRLFHWGPLIAIGITAQVGISATYLHLQWWPINTLTSFLHLSLFLFFNYCVLTNLCHSAFIGPGYVPLHWTPPEKDFEDRLQFCHVCNGYKAPRSHHCSRCGRCVLKMDHHCPWVNNCVGHRNHAFFVRFLAAAVIGCLHAAVIISLSLYHAIFQVWYAHHGHGDEPTVILTVYVFIASVFAFGLALGVIVAVGFLLIVQLRGIWRNRTGIEDYIVDKANSYERELPFIYPYNLGCLRNFREVLGTWNGIPRGNGIWWPVRRPATQFTFSEEQLRQKRIKREHAREVLVIREYAGGCCAAFWIGPRIWCCQPWTDEPRAPVKVGEHWMITRGNKYWVYGRKKEDHTESNKNSSSETHFVQRGWFPRICAHKL